MLAEPQKEHEWLHKLVGTWTVEGECIVSADQPSMKSTGVEVVRSLGNLWTIGEGTGEMSGSGEMKSVMTLGYDPGSKRFVGTFIASMTTHLWVYNGTLDASGKVLTLDTEGPDFSGQTGLVKYQDIIEFVDNDHRILSSQLWSEDGKWQRFMTAHYYRKK